jgi:hypothetical protein
MQTAQRSSNGIMQKKSSDFDGRFAPGVRAVAELATTSIEMASIEMTQNDSRPAPATMPM